jgi:chemotaxis signal transduction protein
MGVAYISGVVHYQGRFITLIDLNKVLSDEALMGLHEVMTLLGHRKEAVA